MKSHNRDSQLYVAAASKTQCNSEGHWTLQKLRITPGRLIGCDVCACRWSSSSGQRWRPYALTHLISLTRMLLCFDSFGHFSSLWNHSFSAWERQRDSLWQPAYDCSTVLVQLFLSDLPLPLPPPSELVPPLPFSLIRLQHPTHLFVLIWSIELKVLGMQRCPCVCEPSACVFVCAQGFFFLFFYYFVF